VANRSEAPDGLGQRAPLLVVERIASHYGRIQALRDVSLEVRPAEIVTLVGANGAGKTTLLRTLSGVQPASGGRVLFKGVDITRARPAARVKAGIAQSPEGRQIFQPLTVADNLRLGAYLRRDGDIARDTERVFDLFPILKEFRGRMAGSLSGGQQQMLAIGRALMSRPTLLLLDEPSLGLAPILVDQVFAAIVRLRADGMTILLVEQNAMAALGIADRGYVLETGAITMTGTGAVLTADDRVREAYLGL
jgi:branched-chain amino acid transport system ATP-binding protein